MFYTNDDAPSDFKDSVEAGNQCARVNIPFADNTHTSHNNNVDENPNYTQKNTGILDRLSGIFIHKIYLPKSSDWSPPEDINPLSYWSNDAMDATENNRQEIIKDLIVFQFSQGVLNATLGNDMWFVGIHNGSL